VMMTSSGGSRRSAADGLLLPRPFRIRAVGFRGFMHWIVASKLPAALSVAIAE